MKKTFATLLLATGIMLPQNDKILRLAAEIGGTLGYSVKISGDYLYIGTNDGLEIIHIENPLTPKKASLLKIDRGIARLAIAGDLAYMSRPNAGANLIIADISDPKNPRLIGKMQGESGFHDVKVRGDYAYAMSTNGDLHIIDIHDPTQPSLVGTFQRGNPMGLLAIKGNTVYVSKNEGGFSVINISDPATPKRIGDVAIQGFSRFMAVLNNCLAVGTRHGTQCFDISIPSTPKLKITLSQFPGDICGKNDTLIVTSGKGLTTMLNVSNVRSPQLIGRFGEYFHDVDFRGNHYFAVLKGLKVLETSNK